MNVSTAVLMCVCFARYNSRWRRMWHVSCPIWSCLYLLVWRLSCVYGKQLLSADFHMCFYINWWIGKGLSWLKNCHKSMWIKKSMVGSKQEGQTFGLFWMIVSVDSWRNTGSCEMDCHKQYICMSCSSIIFPLILLPVLNIH